MTLVVPRADVLFGAQRPRIRTVPPAVDGGAALEAVELAASVGIELDPWQRYVLEDGLGERPDRKWSSFEVGVVVGRQNGKGTVIEARELGGLLLFGEKLVLHTAHEVKTSTEAFLRVLGLFTNYDDLRREVRRINKSHGEEGVELRNGARLRFIARSRVAGRGFSGDCVILDEAFHLADASMAALFPTMAAKPNPQIWYLSSAVNQVHHNHGRVLARLRRRGLSGDSPRLTYLEWSLCEREAWEKLSPAERDARRRDPASWAATNPGLGYRISTEYVESELGALAAEDFDVERLGIGDYPSDDAEAWAVVSEAAWAALADLESAPVGSVAFAADVTPSRSHGSIGVAGRRADGGVHVEVVDHRPGTAWMVPRLVELVEKWQPVATVLDPAGEAGSLLGPLAVAGVEVRAFSARETAQAHGQFLEMVGDSRILRHRAQPELNAALAGAAQRELSDAKTWDRRGRAVDISPLVVVTLAASAFLAAAPAAGFFGAWR